VLCLDIEGGHGGSSRSLYESLRGMDRAAVQLEVWCRRNGVIRDRYRALGITCRIVPGIPKMNAWRRASRNLIGFSILVRDFLRWRAQRNELARIIRERFDVVHFNHEGLAWLASSLRKQHDCAQVMHVRTMMVDRVFGRWQARKIAAAADRIVFISENEKANFVKLTGKHPAGSVIYNIASPPPSERDARVSHDGRFNIAALSNYAFVRGTDRIVEVAEELKARGRQKIRFVVAGDLTLPRNLPGELGKIARAGGTLADFAASRGVADMFLFLGHVGEPERVLAACDALIKLTREANPWGRDILEALAASKPVLSIGRYARFVENDVTGFLFSNYDVKVVADAIELLEADRAKAEQLGANGARRVAELCNSGMRARDLLDVWRQAAAARARQGVDG